MFEVRPPIHLKMALLTVLTLAPSSSLLLSQVPQNLNYTINNLTATPRPGDGHDYIHDLNETVNPANGQLSIKIAAPIPHERALNFPIQAYFYDSNDHRTFQMLENTNLCTASGTGEEGWPACITGLTPPTWITPSAFSHQNPAPNTLTSSVSQALFNWSVSSIQGCAWAGGYTYMDLSGNKHDLHVNLMDINHGASESGIYYTCANRTPPPADSSDLAPAKRIP